MDNEQRDFIRAIRIWGIFIDMILIAVSWIFNYYTIYPDVNWKAFIAVGTIIFVALLIIHVISLELERMSIIPRIQLDGNPIISTGAFESIFFSEQKNSFQRQRQRENANIFIQLPFSNNPKIRTDKNLSSSVRAEIVYVLEDGKQIKCNGNWTNPKNPVSYLDSEMPGKWAITDFPSNGDIRTLTIAVHNMFGNKHWNVWNSKSYKSLLHNGWGEEGFEFDGKIVDVFVYLVGIRVEKEFGFRLHLDSDINNMKVEVLHGQQKKEPTATPRQKRSPH